jgi:hypothetical protein
MFYDEVRAFADKVRRRAIDTVTEASVQVQESVTVGSPVTGAPGQPVDTGALKTSFIPERLSELEWQTTTNLEYATAIEEGVQAPYVRANGTLVTPRPIVFRSAVGGAHSVALTRAAWPQVVELSVEIVTGGDP